MEMNSISGQAIIFINNQGYEDTEKTEPPVSIDIRIDQRFYHYFMHCYPHQDILIIQRMLKNAEQTLNFNYNDVSFTQMIEYIALTLERIATGNIIHEPNILDKWQDQSGTDPGSGRSDQSCAPFLFQIFDDT